MTVEVRCANEGKDYRCTVDIAEAGSSTRHEVRVSRSAFERWNRGRSVEQLVRDSFEFLLKRESKESILRAFDLTVIQRYFPEYDGAA